jgi:hypothetical protein
VTKAARKDDDVAQCVKITSQYWLDHVAQRGNVFRIAIGINIVG